MKSEWEYSKGLLDTLLTLKLVMSCQVGYGDVEKQFGIWNFMNIQKIRACVK